MPYPSIHYAKYDHILNASVLSVSFYNYKLHGRSRRSFTIDFRFPEEEFRDQPTDSPLLISIVHGLSSNEGIQKVDITPASLKIYHDLNDRSAVQLSEAKIREIVEEGFPDLNEVTVDISRQDAESAFRKK